MLWLYSKEHERIALLKRASDVHIISTLSDGDKELVFDYRKDEKHRQDIECEGYILTKTDEYVIKDIESGDTSDTVTAKLNLEELEGKTFPEGFKTTFSTFEQCMEIALEGTGWTFKECNVQKRRTIKRDEGANVIDVIKQCISTYKIEIVYDTINKTISAYDRIGSDRGRYIMETLNLRRLAVGITQQAYICHEGQKLGIINSIFDNESSERVILFASRKTKVKEISHTLKKHGFNVGEMHSDLSQSERDEIMFQYKSRKIDMIVATDILARGIDIDDIRIVINYDVPRDCDDYIHRIGRTARAGTKGRAITLVNVEDQEYFKRIEDFIEQDVPKMELPASLGEAPAYEPKGKQKGGKPRRGGGSNKDKRSGGDRKRNNRKRGGKAAGGEKPQATKPTNDSTQPKETTPVVAPQEGAPKQQGEKPKRRRPHHRRRKPGNAKGGEGAAPVTENK